VAKSFLDRIKNPDAMPWDIRELCATLKRYATGCSCSSRRLLELIRRREVDKKFPGYGTASIGGVLFLRFICPVLVTPDYFGLCSAESTPPPPPVFFLCPPLGQRSLHAAELTPELRRGLLLISKTIQKVANEDSTQTKEDQMVPAFRARPVAA
jgi:hypothetical protein